MHKKIFFLILLIISLTIPIKAYALTDIYGHWAEKDIIILNHAGIINGYNDGTFKPQNAIKRDEFICMVVRLIKDHLGESKYQEVLDHQNVSLEPWEEEFNKVYFNINLPSTYWARYTILESVKLRLLPYEFNTTPFLTTDKLKANLTRGEAAYILTQAATYFDLYADRMLHNYAKQEINDLSDTNPFSKAMLDAYTLGILSGYSDNTIKPNNTMIRAEAVATLIKFYDINRLEPYAPTNTPFVMLNNIDGPLTSLRYYPPLINGEMVLDTLNLVKTVEQEKYQSKGHIQLIYNPSNATLGVEFYNTENDYLQLKKASTQSSYYQTIPYTLYMTLTISPENMAKYSLSNRSNKLNSKYNPYLLISWGNGFEQDILDNHKDFLQEIFNYLFSTEGDVFMNKLEKYLRDGEGGLTTYDQHNGRYASWKPIGGGVVIMEIMEKK